jgi:predicted nucleic acid-binding protein
VIVVSDSSPLITLASVGELDLLRKLYGEVLIPDCVRSEVVQANRPGAKDVTGAGWIRTVSAPDDSFLMVLRTEVDPGEAEAIALAFDVGADTLLLDERSARNLAISMGFDVLGVAGVLLRAKAAGILPFVRPVLDGMRTVGRYRISERLYEATLRDAGEI